MIISTSFDESFVICVYLFHLFKTYPEVFLEYKQPLEDHVNRMIKKGCVGLLKIMKTCSPRYQIPGIIKPPDLDA